MHDNDENKLYNDMSIFDIRNKCKYLSNAIENTIKNYHCQTFECCCMDAITEINGFEKTEEVEFDDSDGFNQRWIITSPRTIMIWYRTFNHINDQCFINQFSNCPKKSLPRLLDANPDLTQAIITYCNNNLLHLTATEVQEYIINTCLPELLEKRKKELQNDNIDMDFLKKENNIKTVCKQTVTNWLKILGFRYCERKKSYYCDSHEKPENVAYRYKYIDRYLEREYRCYRWIQMPEAEYQNMLQEGSIFCGTPYEYYNDEGEKFVEFHIDDNPKFANWTQWPDEDSKQFGGCLSVRMPEGSKPLIIFGQDECIFKQYIFSKKSWVGPEGQTAMTPKEEGQGLMLSSFVSREYGFNYQLSKEELATVNKMREGKSYVDRESAELKRGNALKQELKESPFSRKLEYGSSKDGYWSYEDMVIQLEDCVDVLKALNGGKYDYCFLFDFYLITQMATID